MSYDTDIECGEELARDIESGLISETDLTESGKRKLTAYREHHFNHMEFAERVHDDLDFLRPKT